MSFMDFHPRGMAALSFGDAVGVGDAAGGGAGAGVVAGGEVAPGCVMVTGVVPGSGCVMVTGEGGPTVVGVTEAGAPASPPPQADSSNRPIGAVVNLRKCFTAAVILFVACERNDRRKFKDGKSLIKRN
jgi:hypothetical protein